MKKFLTAAVSAVLLMLFAFPAWAEDSKEVMLGKEGKFAITLPAGYKYDRYNFWYISPDEKVRLTPADASFYSDIDYFEESINEIPGEAKTEQLGKNTLIIKEEDDGFYGPSTLYYINFNGQFKEYVGCRIRVSNFDGLEGTQSPEILKAISSVRRYTPFMDLPQQFDKATTAAMSTFMQGGRYAADGNTVFGQAFDSEGTVEFVRMDLEQKGDFYEVQSHKVIEKGAQAIYLSFYGDYVFYIRSEKGIYWVSKDGSSPKPIIEDAVDYLQIRGNRMYYCDSAYKLKTIHMDAIISEIEVEDDLDKGNSISLQENTDSVFDKEVYYPFMLDEQWLIYQDDADNESLHLRHLPTGADAALTDLPGHGPIVYDSGLYFKTVRDGVETLARIDLTAVEIKYDEETDSFTCSFPAIEYSGKSAPIQLSISASGACYAGLDQGRHVSKWKEIENPEGIEAAAYVFTGPEFDIFWRLKDQKIENINVESHIGGIQSIPRLD